MADFDGQSNGDADSAAVADSYPLPPGMMDTSAALTYIFKEFSVSSSKSTHSSVEQIDSANFMKFAKKAPGLLTKRVTTQHIDVVFTKNKPRGERRLCFHNFLMALSDLAAIRFPDEDPMAAFQFLLTKHIFGIPLQGLAIRTDTHGGLERTATLVAHDLRAPPDLPPELSDQIREQEDASAAASKSGTTQRQRVAGNTRGKIAVARQQTVQRTAGDDQ